MPSKASQHSISEFLFNAKEKGTSELASSIFCNKQLTSTKGGILKAEAAIEFAEILKQHGVEYFQEILKIIDNTGFERNIRGIPGQKSGISLSYFFMLSGSENLIKPDRMILRFLYNTLDREVTTREARAIISHAYDLLKPRYPKLTLRLLDHQIWGYQKKR